MIGFTCGAFDLLHAGHIVMLEEAKSKCDKLIVGLQTDPSIDRPEKNKPIQSVYERFIQLSAVKYIDQIIPYDTEESLMDLLQSQHIDIRFIGEDYREKKSRMKLIMIIRRLGSLSIFLPVMSKIYQF